MYPIVVLGARILDNFPGPLLEERLKKALAIARPEQCIIVSGYNEAGFMADYLRAHGHHNLIEEPEATSTNENLENARKLVPNAPKLIVVTSNFHVLRTRLWAWHLGIPAQVISAPTPSSQRFHNYTREVLATPHSAARIVIRKLKHVWEKTYDY